MSNFAKQAIEIREGAKAVRVAGDAITDRIVRFEAWLAALPGRVEAKTELWSDETKPITRYVAFWRNGKDWVLVLITEEDDGHPVGPVVRDRVLLRDASLVEKMAAVAKFPDLLASIANAQSTLARRVLEAAKGFDVLAAQLGIKEGK